MQRPDNQRMPNGNRGFVLLTVLMILILFTGVSVTTLYTVTDSIKGTGYMRDRIQHFYEADGGWQVVYGYMCERSLTNKSDVDFSAEYGGTGLAYGVTVGDSRVVKRRVAGYSGALLGRDIYLSSVDTATTPATFGSEVLVFIGQAHLTGGYGNE